MPGLAPYAPEDGQKLAAALQRAIPVTRMVDYGVPLGDALEVHARTAGGASDWADTCESLAGRHAELARSAVSQGRHESASLAWRSASALLNCAQLAFHADTLRKRALYEQAHEAMQQHAALAGDVAACVIPTRAGELHAWVVRPTNTPVAAVLLLGGLSGWSAAYLDMARSLAARGLLAILGEGPGQGLTRMRSGMHLGAETLPLLGTFLDQAALHGARRFGVWGNSFGGLFAAHLAAREARVEAVCINGAPMVPAVPDFRTAREQMEALFGVAGPDALADRLRQLAMDPSRDRIAGSMLVVQGGRDPLVPAGEQASFFGLAAAGRTAMLTWEDGEHTIYNHAAERNALVADWFAEKFQATA